MALEKDYWTEKKTEVSIYKFARITAQRDSQLDFFCEHSYLKIDLV